MGRQRKDAPDSGHTLQIVLTSFLGGQAMFSRPMSSKEFLDELGGAATEDTSRGY